MFSKTLFILFVLSFLLDISHGQNNTFRNDYTYIEAVNSFYKIHTVPQTWFNAKRKCGQEEASLFYPQNDEEAQAVMTFRNGSQPDIEWMYVGISDIVSEGVFETVDGNLVSEVYNIWKSGEPNDDLGTHDCVQQNQKGELNDHKCSDKFSYICKKTLLSLGQNYSSNTYDEQNDGELSQDGFTFIKAVNSSYKVYESPQDWQTANEVCAKQGARLFYPENVEEQTAVLSLQNRTSPKIMFMFLGITDIKSEGVFETIDGTLMSYSNWKPYEPNDVEGKEDCVEQDNTGKMNDCKCDTKFSFICKKKFLPPKQNFSCNIDYSLNKDTGKCYKLHTTPLKWSGAHAVCRAEQSHLAVINNCLEADHLAKLTQAASNQRVQGYQLSRGVYHLGFYYKFKEGWRTIKGTPMKVGDDVWWDNRQPIVDEREQCGSMFYTGRLTSINCNTKSFFICEHQAKSSVSEEI